MSKQSQSSVSVRNGTGRMYDADAKLIYLKSHNSGLIWLAHLGQNQILFVWLSQIKSKFYVRFYASGKIFGGIIIKDRSMNREFNVGVNFSSNLSV